MWTIEEIYNGALYGIKDAESMGIYKVYLPESLDLVFKHSTTATADKKKNIKDIELLSIAKTQQCIADLTKGMHFYYR